MRVPLALAHSHSCGRTSRRQRWRRCQSDGRSDRHYRPYTTHTAHTSPPRTLSALARSRLYRARLPNKRNATLAHSTRRTGLTLGFVVTVSSACHASARRRTYSIFPKFRRAKEEFIAIPVLLPMLLPLLTVRNATPRHATPRTQLCRSQIISLARRARRLPRAASAVRCRCCCHCRI